jgi:hypothetical protein
MEPTITRVDGAGAVPGAAEAAGRPPDVVA